MGDDVRKIQERLKSQGFYGGPVDGVSGGTTLNRAGVPRVVAGKAAR